MASLGSNMASDCSKHLLCVHEFIFFISYVTSSSIAWELQLWWVVITCRMCTLESTSILCVFSSMRINHSPLNNGRM